MYLTIISENIQNTNNVFIYIYLISIFSSINAKYTKALANTFFINEFRNNCCKIVGIYLKIRFWGICEGTVKFMDFSGKYFIGAVFFYMLIFQKAN